MRVGDDEEGGNGTLDQEEEGGRRAALLPRETRWRLNLFMNFDSE